MKTEIKTQTRWLIRRDHPAVLDIERACFEYVWTEEDFIYHSRQRNCIGVVAEHDYTIVGFIIYELHKMKLRIINFAVHPDYQRRGVGAGMIDVLKFKISQQPRDEIVVNVRDSNLVAQKFFRSQGFLWNETLHNHYDDTTEDAYVMSYLLDLENE